MNMNRKNAALMWSPEIWSAVYEAVTAENRRTEIAAKFLPIYAVMPETLTVPSDTTLIGGKRVTLTVDEAATDPLIEIWVEFILTPQQVEKEMDLQSARTLAIRATNFLVKGQDTLIFQGQSAVENDPLFTSKRVRFRSGPAGNGLLNAPLPEDQIIEIPSADPKQPVFRERTLRALTEGCARLKGRGQYGPFALILEDLPYGDAYAPLPNTLITAGDRIKCITASGFFGTGTLPADPYPTGLLVSIGGNTMDLVVGYDGTTTFLQEDEAGFYRFRVAKRFALRLKDPEAVIKFVYKTK